MGDAERLPGAAVLQPHRRTSHRQRRRVLQRPGQTGTSRRDDVTVTLSVRVLVVGFGLGGMKQVLLKQEVTGSSRVSGVPEPASRVSSGSLRAHAELLEQRLQAPPILRLHPLLPHRGRHEHGLKSETEKRGGGRTPPPPVQQGGVVEGLTGRRGGSFLYCVLYFGWMVGRGR